MSRLAFPREFYVPQNAVKREDAQSDAVAYLSIDEGAKARWRVVVFYGRQAKPVLNLSYRSLESAERAMSSMFDDRRTVQKYKDERRDERKAVGNPFTVGDIIDSQFGATMWFVRFYEVIESKKMTLIVRPLMVETFSCGDGGYMTPLPGLYAGDAIRARVSGGRVKIEEKHATMSLFEIVCGIKVYTPRSYRDMD